MHLLAGDATGDGERAAGCDEGDRAGPFDCLEPLGQVALRLRFILAILRHDEADELLRMLSNERVELEEDLGSALLRERRPSREGIRCGGHGRVHIGSAAHVNLRYHLARDWRRDVERRCRSLVHRLGGRGPRADAEDGRQSLDALRTRRFGLLDGCDCVFWSPHAHSRHDCGVPGGSASPAVLWSGPSESLPGCETRRTFLFLRL